MRLKNLELNGFKSFAKKTVLEFEHPIVSIVGPNGSGKSNVVEALRFVLGEQSMKSMRGSSGSDLIFKGSKSLSKGSRAAVSIYFDNSDKVFELPNEGGENVSLNYDVISISREVYTDGLNKYILNNTDMRLKDISNLLSSVNIGSSGHHIISQGEADRILNASSRDRREMIEDALGLKIYQYKIKEAKRKLERTANNMKEVSLLRRENAPHLKFLKRQVEKHERAKEMIESLSVFYQEYLKKESIYLENESNRLGGERSRIIISLNEIQIKLKNIEEKGTREESEKEKDLKILENRIRDIHSLRSEVERKLGRIEAMVEIEGRRKKQAPIPTNKVLVSEEKIKGIFSRINSSLDQALLSEHIGEIKNSLSDIKSILREFSNSTFTEDIEVEKEESSGELEALVKSQEGILLEMDRLKEEERTLQTSIENLKSSIAKENTDQHNKEKERFDLRMKHQELNSSLELLSVKEENLRKDKQAFENEIREGSVLIGNEVLLYKNFELAGEIDRNAQEELRRQIERIKIKLEDIGTGGGQEVLKEYEDVSSRDAFLEKETEDLKKSIESLKVLMTDLKTKIDEEFKEGVKKINVEFQNFFSLMFGGGSAKLAIVLENKRKKEEYEVEGEEEIAFEQGIEIDVSLPQKKVKALNALSGGERSLTSIALLFAMSQVNPPPFLVLDETDAALDESNSRKYGDMLEVLSKHSQLIVVTHNRETMSRAGILYGVTIGRDGASKLLSIKLAEAEAIAK